MSDLPETSKSTSTDTHTASKNRLIVEDDWETESEGSDGEWVEEYVYVELDDIANVQELFAVDREILLRTKGKMARLKAPEKPTYPKMTVEMHQLDSSMPVIKIGDWCFECSWESSPGTLMFFKRKESEDKQKESDAEAKDDSDIIPPDPLFGENKSQAEYELSILADKILKTRLMPFGERVDKIPGKLRRLYRPLNKFRLPHGQSPYRLFSGQFYERKNKSKRTKAKDETKPEEKTREADEKPIETPVSDKPEVDLEIVEPQKFTNVEEETSGHVPRGPRPSTSKAPR